MFQFPAFATYTYVFSIGQWSITSIRFPHSDISESKVVSTSSELFAASHVLHRFLEPRHPPYTLFHLTKKKNQSINPEGLKIEASSDTSTRVAYP